MQQSSGATKRWRIEGQQKARKKEEANKGEVDVDDEKNLGKGKWNV